MFYTPFTMKNATIIHGARITPNQTACEMQISHTDADGRPWHPGTRYQPLSTGRDNERGAYYQDVTIDGERVRFYEHCAAVADRQIEELRDEAGRAGDLAQVEICDRALGGDDDAIDECARVIALARSNQR